PPRSAVPTTARCRRSGPAPTRRHAARPPPAPGPRPKPRRWPAPVPAQSGSLLARRTPPTRVGFPLARSPQLGLFLPLEDVQKGGEVPLGGAEAGRPFAALGVAKRQAVPFQLVDGLDAGPVAEVGVEFPRPGAGVEPERSFPGPGPGPVGQPVAGKDEP